MLSSAEGRLRGQGALWVLREPFVVLHARCMGACVAVHACGCVQIAEGGKPQPQLALSPPLRVNMSHAGFTNDYTEDYDVRCIHNTNTHTHTLLRVLYCTHGCKRTRIATRVHGNACLFWCVGWWGLGVAGVRQRQGAGVFATSALYDAIVIRAKLIAQHTSLLCIGLYAITASHVPM